MELLKERIRKDGVVKEGNVLKVDRFLNHQMDVKLFREIGKEFKKRFEGEDINKILTIEASGIGIACVVAEIFDVPVQDFLQVVTLQEGDKVTVEYLEGTQASFVTNAVSHAQTLAKMGIRVYLIGGELKSSTEAVVGSQAMQMIQMYHFTKGFFGTNGITKREGFTTPDTNEAIVKSTAMKQCKDVYVLADATKFGQVSSVTFGEFADGCILTEEIPEEYRESRNILKV